MVMVRDFDVMSDEFNTARNLAHELYCILNLNYLNMILTTQDF